nr:hypothetical protein [Tanacetum cinerariifolium]
MDQQYPTVAKIPILDIGKFEQWQFRIQQYLQHEHYALWDVIEFGDSYEVSASTTSSTTINTTNGETGKKSGRTVTLTAEDMQKKKNDVKARTTLLLSLPDEHQLRFSKYKTARELWDAILKTFGGNETTKKTKKNLLKKQYGNIKAEGLETLEQTFNRLQVIVGQLQFMDNMALLSMKADKFWKKTGKKISIQGSDVPGQGSKAEEQAPKALMAIDEVGWDWSYMANDEEDHALVADEVSPIEFALMANISAGSKVFDNSLCSKDYKKNNDSLNKFADDTVTDYSRPSPTMKSTSGDDQNKNSFVSETVASPITPKPFIKFVKLKDSQSKSKTDETKTPKKPPVKKRVKKSFTPKPVAHRPYRPPVRPVRTNMKGARPNRTSFNKQAHSYANRPFHKTSAVRSHYRAPWVPTVNRNFPSINRKFSTGSRNFPTVNRKFPTASRKFPAGSTKCSTADMGMKGKAVKPSTCWFWKPS